MLKKLLNLKFGITAEEEKEWQKKNITSQKEKYINTDTIIKYKNDEGYRIKINEIKGFLEKYKSDGYILDIGSNTSGESENLFHLGHKMVATDINEIALSYSKIRSKKFRNEQMDYFAIDAHNMPFEEETFDKVVAYEMLHHMEKIDIALKEMFKVLKKGGYLFTVEPYAYNPYRRLSEVRDYFRGTIEKSFSVRKLKKLFIENGFEIIELKKVIFTYPDQKIADSKSNIRKFLKKLYAQVSKKFPSIFGNVYLVAKKPGNFEKKEINIYNNLICPETNEKLIFENNYYVNKSKTRKYSIQENIPVLIK
tara:strand:- start:1185 stop:2111 length:927 start_codon:yes stop_codon:yes gene_type:complete